MASTAAAIEVLYWLRVTRLFFLKTKLILLSRRSLMPGEGLRRGEIRGGKARPY